MINCIPAGHHELETILTMRNTFYSSEGYPYDESKQKSITSDFMLNPQLGMIWIIFETNIAIGYIATTYWYSFERGGKTAFIDELFIHEEHRGKGAGTMAIEFVEKEMKQKGYNSICLEVEPSNFVAKSLYGKKGYKDTHRNFLLKKLH